MIVHNETSPPTIEANKLTSQAVLDLLQRLAPLDSHDPCPAHTQP